MANRKVISGDSPSFSTVKREVSERANGVCECDRVSHEHPNNKCGQPLGNSYYFHYWQYYGVVTLENVKVICSQCHRKITSSRRRIYP